MSLNEQPTYYEILDLKPEASPHEIREAYLRIKSTYNKDSVALYSLVSGAEREEMLRLIEDAYDVLSNADRRKEYDRMHGLLDSRGAGTPPVRPPQKVVSIDRVPPMEDLLHSGEDLLVAPATDFTNSTSEDPFSASASHEFPPASSGFPPSPPAYPAPAAPSPPPATSPFQSGPVFQTPPTLQSAPPAPSVPAASTSPAQPPRFPAAIQRASQASEIAMTLAREIESEIEWSGLFLKRVREVRNVSIEELAGTTKISKTYLQAIEDENFARLPAAVYVRGFVSQMARSLKLPQEKVAAAYMARFAKHATDK
ncbi:MAG: helix-turn-helix domain-containing protein [Oligoflexia bacterium]|nr:helix-turn-helix domain-containing protein [Oligoflexia bacterium]